MSPPKTPLQTFCTTHGFPCPSPFALRPIPPADHRSAQVFTLHDTRHPTGAVAVLKRARANALRVKTEAAALAAITQHPCPDFRAAAPTPIAVDTSHSVRALLMSRVGAPHAINLAHWMRVHPGEHVPARIYIELGRWLATLHAIRPLRTSGIKLADDPFPWPDRMIRQVERGYSKQRPADAHHALMTRASAHLIDRIPRHIARTPAHLIHRDLRAQNIMVEFAPGPGGKRAWRFAGVVDFERSCRGEGAWDFVKARWWIAGGRGEGDEVMRRVREGYEDGARISGGRVVMPAPEVIKTYAMYEAFMNLAHTGRTGNRYDREMVTRLTKLTRPGS